MRCDAGGPSRRRRLRLGRVARGENAGSWVFVEAEDVDGGWTLLREELLGPRQVTDIRPHVTLIHPRTTNRGPAAWSAIAGMAADAEFIVEELAITAFAGNSWRTIERFALGPRGM
jgi:hypothetical protein